MKWTIREQITELNQTYNNLGEDLLLIESIVIASNCENEFPSEYITSSLRRIMDYTEQHLGEIQGFAQSLLREAPHRRELPRQYGRDLRQHPETDASPDTHAGSPV